MTRLIPSVSPGSGTGSGTGIGSGSQDGPDSPSEQAGEPATFVAALRAAAPYVHAHHGRTFVIAFPGEICARPDVERLFYDIALLSSLGVKLVLVHGARPQIDAQLALRAVTPRFVGDMRITDPPTMEAVKAAVGALRMDIEAMLSCGLENTPMGGAQLTVAGGNWVTARPRGIRDGVDYLLTGDVRRVDIPAVRDVLTRGQIALLSPVGYSPTGEIFNVRNAELARTVACGLGADKLVFVLESDPSTWKLAARAGDAGQLPLSEAEELLASAADDFQLSGEDSNCLWAAFEAGKGGVTRVHLIGIGAEGALLRELYTRDGAGLMLSADEDYESTREATMQDIGGIRALIKPLEDTGALVARSRERLELEIGSFSVMVRDGTVIACNALIEYPEDQSAEFACLAVHPSYRRGERAAVLLRRAESLARRRGIRRVFALTTRTSHWFIEHGFSKGEPDDLPAGRRQSYNEQRNSLVLVKDLTDLG